MYVRYVSRIIRHVCTCVRFVVRHAGEQRPGFPRQVRGPTENPKFCQTLVRHVLEFEPQGLRRECTVSLGARRCAPRVHSQSRSAALRASVVTVATRMRLIRICDRTNTSHGFKESVRFVFVLVHSLPISSGSQRGAERLTTSRHTTHKITRSAAEHSGAQAAQAAQRSTQ